MSGHSKWSTIKRKKGAADAKRGQLFTKFIKEITVAARIGGGDINGNPRLRKAVATAKENSMPSDNIDRAIKKGTGELEGTAYEEITYEGYGPSGVALLIEAMTDNKNRTVAELRNLLSKKGGNLGESGCVAWMFEKKGLIQFDKKLFSEETIMDRALQCGAEDVREGEEGWEIICDPGDFDTIDENLRKSGMAPQLSEITMIPNNTVQLAEENARKVLALMEALEEHDDVQKVHANFDIPLEIMDKLGQ